MKAYVLEKYGGAAKIEDMPDPALRDSDVLVEVRVASLNPLDAKIATGQFKLILPYKLPLIMGNDAAGVVVQTGPNVSRFKVGDEAHAARSSSKSVRRTRRDSIRRLFPG